MSYRAEKLKDFEIRLREAKSLSMHEREIVKDTAMKTPWTIGKSHACYKHFDKLNPICLGQMKSPKVYLGCYLLMRVVTKVNVQICSELIAEDVKGDVEGICFYNFDPTLENTKLIKEGTILIIKEPNLRLTNMSGDRFIRVDSPSDVIFINQWDKAFLERVNALRWHKPEELTFDQLKKNGNDQFNKNQYEDALHFYDRALAKAELEEQSKIIHLNRAAALLPLERFLEAEEAATKALGVNLKALHRLGKAAYGMRNWAKAVEWFEALVEESNKLGDVNAAQNAIGELEKAKERLAESTTGIYDQWKLFGFTQNGKKVKQEKFFDMADYIGPVKIAKIPGKGMGLVVTENVEKGRLLLASKAYAMIYKKNNAIMDGEEDLPKLTIQCVMEIVQKLHKNPQTAKDLYALYAGPEVDREKNKIPPDVIDAERIELIINQNAFLSEDNIIGNELHYEIPGIEGGQHLREDVYQMCHGYGLWLLPSFINHACFNNCVRYTCGDMMFIYSLCDLKIGDQVTINYCDPFQSLSEREKKIRHQWKFNCDCKLCKLERADPNGKKRNILLDRFQKQISQVHTLIYYREALTLTESHLRQLHETYSGREDQLHRLHLLPAILRQVFALEHMGKLVQAAELLREILDQISPQLSVFRYQHLPYIHSHLARICAKTPQLGGLEAAKRIAEEAFELFAVKTGVKDRKLFGKMLPEFDKFLMA